MASTTLSHSKFLVLLLLHLLPTVLGITVPDCRTKLNSSLSTDGASSWNSPSEEFAFGFRSVQLHDQQFVPLLAIWFTKVSNQTIVWFAKDSAVPAGSTVKLTNKGITVYDPQGNERWRRPEGDGIVSCASLLDDGNFVLLDKDGKHVWESFEEPTDTLLPGQNLTRPKTLRARKSDSTFSDGPFELRWQDDGNLVLYQLLESESNDNEKFQAYWSTENSNPQSQLIFNEFGEIYIRNSTTKISNLSSGIPGSKEYYYMARIDSDGVFRLYNYRKANTGSAGSCVPGGWNILATIPEDICVAFLMETGNVICGFNSYCVKINGETECWCPENYLPFTHDNLTSCRPDFPVPNCQIGGWEQNKDLVDFKEYKNIDWPLTDYDFMSNAALDKDMCRQRCLDDCFCAAAIYDTGRCWKKKYPLSNGRKSKRVTRIALIKVPKVNLKKNNRGKSTLVLVISILFGSSMFLNILLCFGLFVAFFFLRNRKLLNLQPPSSLSGATVRSYTYKELEEATGGFKQILGQGTFGTVYKGVLESETRRYVAVKKVDKAIEEGEKEFKNEVSVIGQTHHRNLVRLLGYCYEGENRLLVYEYMSNGSLASFLFGISRPLWNQRVQIALGIARGLKYLHEECSTQIIHCDIKPQNIHLDEFFTPRISDFGLAKLLLAEQTQAARTGVRGTAGYLAPEWFRKASITSKVDVYSFGVMLLEIICCKSSASFAMESEEDEALIDWAYDCYSKGKYDQLVENDKEAMRDRKRLKKLVMVAIWCIQEDPSLRPSMKKVTQMLEDVTEVSVPPRPSRFSLSS